METSFSAITVGLFNQDASHHETNNLVMVRNFVISNSHVSYCDADPELFQMTSLRIDAAMLAIFLSIKESWFLITFRNCLDCCGWSCAQCVRGSAA